MLRRAHRRTMPRLMDSESPAGPIESGALLIPQFPTVVEKETGIIAESIDETSGVPQCLRICRICHFSICPVCLLGDSTGIFEPAAAALDDRLERSTQPENGWLLAWSWRYPPDIAAILTDGAVR